MHSCYQHAAHLPPPCFSHHSSPGYLGILPRNADNAVHLRYAGCSVQRGSACMLQPGGWAPLRVSRDGGCRPPGHPLWSLGLAPSPSSSTDTGLVAPYYLFFLFLSPRQRLDSSPAPCLLVPSHAGAPSAGCRSLAAAHRPVCARCCAGWRSGIGLAARCHWNLSH